MERYKNKKWTEKQISKRQTEISNTWWQKQRNGKWKSRFTECLVFYLLDCEVLRGFPMYFRMGFLFLSSPSFLAPLTCKERTGQVVYDLSFHFILRREEPPSPFWALGTGATSPSLCLALETLWSLSVWSQSVAGKGALLTPVESWGLKREGEILPGLYTQRRFRRHLPSVLFVLRTAAGKETHKKSSYCPKNKQTDLVKFKSI